MRCWGQYCCNKFAAILPGCDVAARRTHRITVICPGAEHIVFLFCASRNLIDFLLATVVSATAVFRLVDNLNPLRLSLRLSPSRHQHHTDTVTLTDTCHETGAGLNDGIFQKRWTSAVNRWSIVTLPSVLPAVCIAQN